MPCRIITVVGAAAALLLAAGQASTARAQVYLSGNIGAMISRDPDTSISRTGVSVNGDIQRDTGFTITGAAGYSFGDIRFESELSYRLANIGSFTASSVTGGGFGNITKTGETPLGDASISIIGVMGNLWYDVDTGTKWRPTFGGGAGLAIAHFFLGDQDTLSNSFKDNDYVFAYQFGAGLGYQANPSTTLSISYRYFGSADPVFTDRVNNLNFQIKTDITDHSVLLGYLYKF